MIVYVGIVPPQLRITELTMPTLSVPLPRNLSCLVVYCVTALDVDTVKKWGDSRRTPTIIAVPSRDLRRYALEHGMLGNSVLLLPDRWHEDLRELAHRFLEAERLRPEVTRLSRSAIPAALWPSVRNLMVSGLVGRTSLAALRRAGCDTRSIDAQLGEVGLPPLRKFLRWVRVRGVDLRIAAGMSKDDALAIGGWLPSQVEAYRQAKHRASATEQGRSRT
jgi:hypothetical protein